jgi:hypothetical protein
MALYYFHVIDGEFLVDEEGTECADMREVRDQAITSAGEILRDKGGTYPAGAQWQMHVTDAERKTVFRLNFSAENVA